MANIVSCPEGLCFSENLPKFIVADVEGKQEVRLLKNGVEILLETYESLNNKIEVNFSEIIKEELSLSVPNLNTNSTLQEMAVTTFTVSLGGINKSFDVLKGGVLDLSRGVSDFCKENFLTHQPQLKGIRPYQPEFLTYYAIQNCEVKIRAFFTNKDSETISYKTLSVGNLVSINVSYSQISPFFSKAPSAYDVYIADTSGTRISIVQRYALIRDFYEVYAVYLFENTVGGFDTLVCKGERRTKNDIDFKTAALDDSVSQYDLNTKFAIEQNVGLLHRLERVVFDGFAMSKNRLEFIDNALKPIYLQKVKNNTSTEDDLSDASFTYFYSKQSNVQKSQKVLNDLPLPEGLVPADDLFFLISEAAQHTHYNLSLLNALSYEDGYLLVDGERIKASLADSTRNALLWAGHHFQDYIDQPLRTSDDVVHKSLSSKNFASGFSGEGFRIDEDGNATFENLVIRNQMRVYEMIINKIRATNGAVWVSDSMKYEEDYGTDDTSYKLGVDDKDNGRTVSFQPKDIILAQHWTAEGIRRTVLVVDSVDISGKYVSCLKSSLRGAVPQIGDDFVRIGNLENQERQGALYMTSSDANAPYLDVLDGVSSDDFSGKTKVRLGKLDGIEDPILGALLGYGLYAENAYLKGVFHVTGGNAETKEGSAALVQDLINSLGNFAYVDKVEKAMLGDTIIKGGYLRNELIDVVSREKNFVLDEVVFSNSEDNAKLLNTAGSIIHKGLSDTTLVWDISEGVISNLNRGKYYLYVKAPKNDAVATIIATESMVALEEVSNFYHIPLGTLSAVVNNVRSIHVSGGYTRIAPGEMTTGRWNSPYGEDYIEFGKNGIEFKGNVTFRSGSGHANLADWAAKVDAMEFGGRNYLLASKSREISITNTSIELYKISDSENLYNQDVVVKFFAKSSRNGNRGYVSLSKDGTSTHKKILDIQPLTTEWVEIEIKYLLNYLEPKIFIYFYRKELRWRHQL